MADDESKNPLEEFKDKVAKDIFKDKAERNRFDEAGRHPYDCQCPACYEWWQKVPRETDANHSQRKEAHKRRVLEHQEKQQQEVAMNSRKQMGHPSKHHLEKLEAAMKQEHLTAEEQAMPESERLAGKVSANETRILNELKNKRRMENVRGTDSQNQNGKKHENGNEMEF